MHSTPPATPWFRGFTLHFTKGWFPKGYGRFATRFARIDLRESFAIETPIFIGRQADSPVSLEFPIRASHPIRANRANRFAQIMPLRWFPKGWFWQMFPLYRNLLQQVFPCTAALAEESYNFSYSWIRYFRNPCDRDPLSDPRNRNHKSLAIGNHNFEVASFSRRNRSKIAVSQSQKSHWATKIVAIQNHTLVVATYSPRVPRPMWRF